MKIGYKIANFDDIEDLVILVEEFYEHEHIEFEEKKIIAALQAFFGRSQYGRIWIIKDEHQIIGYVIFTFVFSLEYGGLNALLDEFYIKEKFRGKGIGTNTLKFIENECVKDGVNSIHLQVFKFNREAERLYLRHGYTEIDRIFMTKIISE